MYECSRCEGFRVSMVIQVKIKNVYGNEKIYPVCKKAEIFASLVGQTTLTPRDISYIKMLGYEVKVMQDVVKL